MVDKTCGKEFLIIEGPSLLVLSNLSASGRILSSSW
jgi:hypothetical protein